MRILAIVNPVAGKRSAAHTFLQGVRQDHLFRTWDVVTTEHPGHARQLALTAAAEGYERVIAIGGDGTVNEVANGLAHTGTALGIIPLGTGNDSASNLGVPTDPLAAADLALSAEPRPIDLGEICTNAGTVYFVNVAGFGFDAAVAWRVNRMPKLTGGTLPYLAGVFMTLWQYRAAGVRIRVDDQAVIDRPVFLAAVANSASYGGGMRIVPHARPDDGMFDVCVVSDLPRFEVLRLVPKIYSGGHVGHPAVEMLRCASLTAETTEQVRCQADGELVGDLPAQFKIHPAALRCVTGG